MRAIVWGSGTYLVLSLITTGLMNWPTASLQWILIRARLSGAAETVVVVLLAAAHWKLGQPQAADPMRTLARLAYRGGALVSACAKVAWLCMVLYAPMSRAANVTNWVEICAIVMATVGFFGYLRELALRVPNDRLARAARVLQWNTGIALIAYAGAGLWVQIAQPRPPMPRMVLGVAGLAAAMCLVGAVGGTVVLLGLKRPFAEAAITTSGGAAGG